MAACRGACVTGHFGLTIIDISLLAPLVISKVKF